MKTLTAVLVLGLVVSAQAQIDDSARYEVVCRYKYEVEWGLGALPIDQQVDTNLWVISDRSFEGDPVVRIQYWNLAAIGHPRPTRDEAVAVKDIAARWWKSKWARKMAPDLSDDSLENLRIRAMLQPIVDELERTKAVVRSRHNIAAVTNAIPAVGLPAWNQRVISTFTNLFINATE